MDSSEAKMPNLAGQRFSVVWFSALRPAQPRARGGRKNTGAVSAISTDRFVLHIPANATVLPEVLDCMLSSIDRHLAFAEASLGHQPRAPVHHLRVDEAPRPGSSIPS